ncbi:putative molybdenum carrier protein [Calycomorphotria hydatis]|uniref:Molybdenum carrier n=1 Tax=Calycomorphotria hydatis TaxID=2528027 RepID=A0A517T849_9PLAN|nr:putative molybdenum carrier protein [Calycomorphotria hydatis]QDT64532.1 Putative molybdenum carrier [Calycomorphotria hydatis]
MDELRFEIVSGGQTGVDRAAIDVALRLGIPCHGWCPAGRRAEDGVIAERYPLHETPDSDYTVRTKWNVRDSDGTLILYRGELSGGTLLTAKIAMELQKPVRLIEFEQPVPPLQVAGWLRVNRIAVLNVAGPRESNTPGIYDDACEYLEQIFRAVTRQA